MSRFEGKRIVLGVGGGIAAYKMADLASKLTQEGAQVLAVLTAGAARFIQPLTFQALTHQPVHTGLWVPEGNAASGATAGMPHIELADKADCILIAPASANLLSRLAAGAASDLLTALVLATSAPVLVAPAMNPTMLGHPATQRNLALLREWGYRVVEPESGHMACEHTGRGRLPPTGVLMEAIASALWPRQPLLGKRIVVTAGPTHEALDPVRFLGNRSSGKMGYALAAEATARGAQVTLISGPVELARPTGVETIVVTTALEMRDATVAAFAGADVLVAAAAPADFRPAQAQGQKIKRGQSAEYSLQLVANPDIVAECAARKGPGQLVIGFAAETQNLLEEARRKLRDKQLDAIAANDVSEAGSGFNSDVNRVTWVTATTEEAWPLESKRKVAARIWDAISELGG